MAPQGPNKRLGLQKRRRTDSTYDWRGDGEQVIAELGIRLSERQMKRAAEADIRGRRKLPFFIDPIDGKLKIEKGALVRIYRELEVGAENNTRKLEDQFARHAGPKKE